MRVYLNANVYGVENLRAILQLVEQESSVISIPHKPVCSDPKRVILSKT
jgi:kynurenine formamidase